MVPASETRHLHARIRELERLLGRKTVENEVLRAVIKLAPAKTISRMPLFHLGDIP